MQNTIKFDMEDLQKMINDATVKSGSDKKEYTKTSYLPKGSHSVNFFFDPKGKMFREVVFHKIEKNKTKCLCPNRLNYDNKNNPNWPSTVQSYCEEWADKKLSKLPDCEICAINAKVKEFDTQKFGDPKKGKGWNLKIGAQYNCLLYVVVYSTTATVTKYWQVDEAKGSPCVLLGNKTLKDTLTSLMEEYGKKASSYAIKALNPSIPSPPFTIINNDKLTITAIPQDDKPAIIEDSENPPGWWNSLDTVFLDKQFDLASYNENVKIAEDAFEKYKESFSDKKNDASKVQNNNQSNVSLNETTEEAKSEKNLNTQTVNENQVITRMQEVVTLPDYAVERQCWTKFNPEDALCMECPVKMECSFEQD